MPYPTAATIAPQLQIVISIAHSLFASTALHCLPSLTVCSYCSALPSLTHCLLLLLCIAFPHSLFASTALHCLPSLTVCFYCSALPSLTHCLLLLLCIAFPHSLFAPTALHCLPSNKYRLSRARCPLPSWARGTLFHGHISHFFNGCIARSFTDVSHFTLF